MWGSRAGASNGRCRRAMVGLAAVAALLAVLPRAAAQYAGDIGWVFTGDDEFNTAGQGAAVGGGDFNTAQGTGTFTLGGTYNSAAGIDSLVGGGFENTVEQTSQSSMIGGGEKNLIASRFSLIVGGLANVVSANYGVILGGYKGTVSGNFGLVVGGSKNAATGKISSAYGYRAKAYHDYSLVLGFAGKAIGDCESTDEDQIAMCTDSWMLNDVELMDLFSRRQRRALVEYSVSALKQADAAEDGGDVLLTEDAVAAHERELQATREANAELAETIALLAQEVSMLAEAQAAAAADARTLAAEHRRLVGVETEYVEDEGLEHCAVAHRISTSGSGESACVAGCDSIGLECAAFVLDGSGDCHYFYVCSQEKGTAVSGTVFKKHRTEPDAYDVDVVSYVDYQLLLAEEQMDLLSYELKWAEIAVYTGGTCESDGVRYLAMDVANHDLYLCDGAGSWVQLALADSIPAPANSDPPAPWHNFENITQDVWNLTDTHRYVQTGPLEDAVKPHDVNQCNSDPCQNGATCIDHGGALTVADPFDTFECVCADGYEGITCEGLLDDCSSNPCASGATCSQDNFSYTCACETGYDGFNCDNDIDDCKYHDCVHGTCVDDVDSFTCDCETGWNGTYCDTLDLSEGYYSVGTGRCTDVAGLLPDKCESTDASTATLFDCMQVCDDTPECDAVQFRHTTGACGIMIANDDPPTMDARFTCSSGYTELLREGFEATLADWSLDTDSVLAAAELNTEYVKVGSKSFRMSGGAVVNNLKTYESTISLVAADGVVSGSVYVASVWVNHVSNIISDPQPTTTGAMLSISDSSRVLSSTATATADARHWEQLSVTFTAQADATLVVALEIPYDYVVDTYWDELVVWTGAGRSTVGVDGSTVQAVQCYRTFETPVPTAYTTCAAAVAAGVADGAYVFNGTEELYCRDERGGGAFKLDCKNAPLECERCAVVVSESGSWALGYLHPGMGQFATRAAWATDKKVRLEWYDAAGEWQWVQFVPDSTVFLDRGTTTMTGAKANNIVIDLPEETFSTSVAALQALVTGASGAIFCLSTEDRTGAPVHVAWAVLPADHDEWGAGCVGTSYAGAGVFYADNTVGAGFVGYVADGDAKGMNDGATHLDLNVYVCDSTDTDQLQLWLRADDYRAGKDTWGEHRPNLPAATGVPPKLAHELTNTAGGFPLNGSGFDVALDIGPTAMPELTLAIWVNIRHSPNSGNPGWIVGEDDNTGDYHRGIMLHDAAFGTVNASLAMGIGETYLSDILLAEGKWYHVAAVWHADDTATMYVDGVAYAVPVSGFTVVDGTGTLSVGDHAAGSVNAELGELRVYDLALTASQVRAVFGEGSAEFVN